MAFFLVEYVNRETGQRYSPGRMVWLNSEAIEAFSELSPGTTLVVLRSGTPYLMAKSTDALASMLTGVKLTTALARLLVRCRVTLA
jgi:uncharacterized protein YlzI (FlbEa/FlbD family)